MEKSPSLTLGTYEVNIKELASAYSVLANGGKKVEPHLITKVVDKKGNVYKTCSFVNADIFLDEKDLMQSAYYANKIPQYW